MCLEWVVAEKRRAFRLVLVQGMYRNHGVASYQAFHVQGRLCGCSMCSRIRLSANASSLLGAMIQVCGGRHAPEILVCTTQS